MSYKAKSKLKEIRSDLGSTRKIASEIGIHYAYFSDVQNGKRSIRADNAIKIASYFGRKVEDLFEKYHKKGGANKIPSGD